ncbi:MULTISPECIES: metallophosphoesterase [Peptoniphilus]|uniref:metallophosphoesterase n=1 Tax=Peptoniphilus TaxID=162289 RepID=UPI0001DA9B2E|nr:MULTISPECIES: metallophosphoesterase [Peptoniphilus]EFI42120.1 Ser/Thr phosphatase family protein [Peptoniphilus sp. oral taxon 386 str. F0131]
MIWALGDLHFDPIGDKPMDIFGKKWINHEGKIISYWKEKVSDDDLVLLPGDISWGLKLKDALSDLQKIDALPGNKIISKGNHDYWWGSLSKMNSLGLKTIKFLNNNSYVYNDIEIFGSRGWMPKDFQDFSKNDEKIYQREVLRIKNSLESGTGAKKKIAMIHYPPFNQDFTTNEFSNLFSEYGIDICIYGHLHADGHKYVVEGNINGVEYICVSSDYVDFKVQELKI